MYAKHYENPTMLSRVTAKNVGDVFLRHTADPKPLEQFCFFLSKLKLASRRNKQPKAYFHANGGYYGDPVCL